VRHSKVARRHVRVGSFPDLDATKREVRFTPANRHPLSANNGSECGLAQHRWCGVQTSRQHTMGPSNAPRRLSANLGKEGLQMRYHEFAANGGVDVIICHQPKERHVRKVGCQLLHLGKARIKFSRKKQTGHRQRRQHVGVGLAILGQRTQGIEVVGGWSLPARPALEADGQNPKPSATSAAITTTAALMFFCAPLRSFAASARRS
jgi:hypothetical protein